MKMLAAHLFCHILLSIVNKPFPTFDFRALINLIPLQSRFDILKIHSRKMNLMRGIDLKKIAEKMNGASGAELKVCWRFCLTLA